LSKKLHILFLSGWYPSRVLPSNGDFVQRHAEAVATKHKVTLVHLVTDDNILKIERTTEIKNNIDTTIIYIPKSKNPLFKWFLFIKIYLSELSKIDNFNIVHLNITFPVGIIALYIKWFKKVPYIISEHWTGYQSPLNKSISFAQKLTTKIIIKNASFTCPVSNNLANEMVNYGLKGNYYAIPNVINTNIFNISENNSNNFIISHISHMRNDHKNVEGIINTIFKLQNKIPNLKFNLIGDDSKKYKTKIEKLKIKNTHIIDHISNIEVANYLKKSNLFILFSNYENLPCVILEAFACGVPVISTNVGGISEYFPENFGFLINSKDEIALENSILKIYNQEINPNKELMHKYAQDNFGISSICENFSNLYIKSLNK